MPLKRRRVTGLTRAALAGLVLTVLFASTGWPQSPPATRGTVSIERIKLGYRRPARIPFPADNAYSKERETLGEALFFDPRLSSSNAMSCATCHDPDKAWSDGRPRAVGLNGKILPRRTPTILNVAWSKQLFWDGRAEGLEAQAAHPLESPDEMNQSLGTTATRLREIEGYRKLFELAYPGEGITPQTIVKALATFERTIVSAPAPFDAWVAGDAAAISASAVQGLVVFHTRGNCTICHSGWSFSDGKFHDIGVPSADIGRGAFMPIVPMQHAFKTPTLRDVERRAPYMHDGSSATLMDTVDLYDRGGEARPSRSPDVHPLRLTAQEREDLVAFMKTLTSTGPPRARPELPR